MNDLSFRAIKAQIHAIVNARDAELDNLDKVTFNDPGLQMILRDAIHTYYLPTLQALNRMADVAEWYETRK